MPIRDSDIKKTWLTFEYLGLFQFQKGAHTVSHESSR